MPLFKLMFNSIKLNCQRLVHTPQCWCDTYKNSFLDLKYSVTKNNFDNPTVDLLRMDYV